MSAPVTGGLLLLSNYLIFTHAIPKISNSQPPIADLEHPYKFSVIDTMV